MSSSSYYFVEQNQENLTTVSKSPIKIAAKLDKSELAVQFDKTDICQYELIPVINLAAWNVSRGHYTVTLFDGKQAIRFDDKHTRQFDAIKLLKREGVYANFVYGFLCK